MCFIREEIACKIKIVKLCSTLTSIIQKIVFVFVLCKRKGYVLNNVQHHTDFCSIQKYISELHKPKGCDMKIAKMCNTL